MGRSKRHRDKEQSRFYLLPGQGGRLYRKKQKIIIGWSLLVAVLVSAIMIAIMIFTDRY